MLTVHICNDEDPDDVDVDWVMQDLKRMKV